VITNTACRRIHHLVYPTTYAPRPVACGASYEEAKAKSAVLPGAPIISLLVSGFRAADTEGFYERSLAQAKVHLCTICKT